MENNFTIDKTSSLKDDTAMIILNHRPSIEDGRDSAVAIEPGQINNNTPTQIKTMRRTLSQKSKVPAHSADVE